MSNLKPLQPFSSEHQPARKGRKKGSKNRATLLKKWLAVKVDVLDPATGDPQKGTVEDEIVLSLISKAKFGDVRAIEQILDSVYGRLTENQNINLNLSELSDEDLEAIARGESI